MSEIRSTPENVASSTKQHAETPQTRENLHDLVEVRLTQLSPEELQLANLPEKLAEKIFAQMAKKGIPAIDINS